MGNDPVIQKVVILGMHTAGKTQFSTLMQPQLQPFVSDFNNFKYRASDHTVFDVWDLNGLEPHLWNHHYLGVEGIVYLISE